MAERGKLETVGKYPVIRKLGEGATSEVYLCRDPFNNRDVAVKVAYPETFQDPERGELFRRLFLTEASLAGKLQHPHICQIHDAVAEEKVHYLVMEYVDGGTLERYCRVDGLLPPARIVEMAFKCTRALEFAHRLGITHRDLKPANILHTGETNVKISDFGGALIAKGEATQVGSIGSPAYMSPEQVKEQPLDHRTDIYSIGVSMYQLLTGRLPFQGANNFSLMYQITGGKAERPSALRKDLPPEVEAIVLRAMARERDDRYPTWGEFSRELAQVFSASRSAARKAQDFADSDRFETLRALAFFTDFSDAELWEVAHISSWRHADAGQTLMKEGDAGEDFCILAEGEVKVTRRGKLLGVVRPGECFGEMAYLAKKDHRRGADVTVSAESNVISIPTARLAQISESCRHKFDRAFMTILVERLSAANLRLSGV
ncbi:MAG TPA: serine/threonine-protein kinase [Burkholderiales bacterium]|nr:serine/threonine-protein kinase [Burkholderiales bacterium]